MKKLLIICTSFFILGCVACKHESADSKGRSDRKNGTEQTMENGSNPSASDDFTNSQSTLDEDMEFTQMDYAEMLKYCYNFVEVYENAGENEIPRNELQLFMRYAFFLDTADEQGLLNSSNQQRYDALNNYLSD